MEAAAVIIAAATALVSLIGAIRAYREQVIASDVRLIEAQEKQIAKLEARIALLQEDVDERDRTIAQLRQQSGSPPKRPQVGL